MKVTRIILLGTSAAIGANAQVSSSPRLRKNVMKEADRRRLQTTTISCTGIDDTDPSVDGYGSGCVQLNDSATCTKDSNCKTGVYNKCFLEGTGATNTCVCIVPTTSASTTCNSGSRPCCKEDEECNGGICEIPVTTTTTTTTTGATTTTTGVTTTTTGATTTTTGATTTGATTTTTGATTTGATTTTTGATTTGATTTGATTTGATTTGATKPTVDKKELLLLLVLLKLAFLDYLKDLVWSSSAWSSSSSSWSGDSWDKPDTPPSGKAGKSGSTGESGSKAFKGKGGKGSSTKAPSSFQGDAPAPPVDDELGWWPGGVDIFSAEIPDMMIFFEAMMTTLMDQMFEAMQSIQLGNLGDETGDRRRRTLEAVDINGIKAKFMKRIQTTTFNGRRDLEVMFGAGAGMMGTFQDILTDNKDLFESEDMAAVEAKLELLLKE